ncbi:MAG: hypothetical protein KF681_03785 [Bdellovibrionaceae bacterium]|nr:hypothetical protein [Pseudobdellovibrionaceae bacterium]
MTVQKDLNQKKETISHKLGDKIERVGEKISDAGAPKVGNAIRNAGDKLEHSQDNKTFKK